MVEAVQLVFEDVMVGGPPPLQLELATVPLAAVALDPNNPRLRYAKSATGKSAFELLFEEDDTKKLKEDIKRNGLFERPFVRRTTLMNGVSYVAFEGNRRIACYQQLNAEDPSNQLWQNIPVRILPPSTTDRQLALMLGQFHVAGKLKWNPHERAGHIYQMAEVLKMPDDEIKLCLHMGKPAIDKAVASYKMMMEVFIVIDGGSYKTDVEGKYSYFDEFFKQKDLREKHRSDPHFAEDFCRWVGEQRIPTGADVRRLAAILRDGPAYRAFVSTAPDNGQAWQAAINSLELSDVSQKSDFFKKVKLLIKAAGDATMGDVSDAQKPAGRQLIRDAKARLDTILKQAEHA